MAEKFARENNLIFVGESSSLANQNNREVMDALLESNYFATALTHYLGIYMVQSELVKKGKKSLRTLKISEEEIMLNNHRCCY
jgi:hypothetical protein